MFSAERTVAVWHGVVVGFDGTDRARCAVRWAAGEAAARRCPLHVVRVVVHHTPAVVAGWVPALVGPDELERDLIEDQLVAEVHACRAAHPGLEVHAAMHDGAPYARLAEHADQVGADVLAVGSSEPGTVSRLVFGSTGAELVRSTSRLVVVVRDLTPVQEAAMATGYAPVVALVDDQETSARVLAFAGELAERWGTSVTVTTDPHQVVLEQSTDARLVVVGDRRQGVVHRLLSGSAGHRVLHHARCSVAVVPS